jgi:cell wall-associated protease
MIKRSAGFVLTIVIFLLSMPSYGFQQDQESQDTTTTVPKDWFLKDPETDHVQGVSSEKTYSTLLNGKPSRTVVVAVIDSGIDIDHEDLKDVLWVNRKEVAGNGIDDDKNGYVDDVHGWNFIGGKNGNVNEDTYEVTREYARLRSKYDSVDEKSLSKKEKEELAYYRTVKAKYDRDYKFNKEEYDQYKEQYQMYANAYLTINFCDSLLEKVTGKPVSKSSLVDIEATNDTVTFAKQTLTKILESIEGDVQVSEFLDELEYYISQLKEGYDHYRVAVEYGYNTDFNSRLIVGDDPNNLYEKNYGNNDVEGPDPKHGTHVAGIIGANRSNNIGINGIANNVQIMSVRAVPNGDERDKDVANAIIYATDNGAQIINMSFGKSFSPGKEAVDKAVKYAESKGVLIIHAAGNDHDNLDVESNFPNKTFSKGGQAKNWLEIGASSWGADENFVGTFSNYGKKSVDLFAPGVQIYSTTPDNTYEDLQGTSMACPATSGVAAVLLSYFPHLSAEQVKDILKQSTRKFDNLKVTKPGSKDMVPFNELSSSGGLVNVYEAVKLAMEVKPKGKK